MLRDAILLLSPNIYSHRFWCGNLQKQKVKRTALFLLFSPKRESMKEFFLLQRTLGKGESACMIYCRDNRDVLGSSSLKDIKEYCSKNNITYLTTLDFLYYAYCRKKMTEQECKEFMQEVNNAGSKLPIIDITQYTCTVQI